MAMTYIIVRFDSNKTVDVIEWCIVNLGPSIVDGKYEYWVAGNSDEHMCFWRGREKDAVMFTLRWGV